MDDLTSYTRTEAQEYLEKLDLDLKPEFREEYHDSIPAGVVIQTQPAAGQVLRKGQKVIITISLGVQKQFAKMPDFIRGIYTKKSDAESMMNSMGFTNVEWVPINSLMPENTVVSQSIAAGEMVDITTKIVIEYSNGIPPEKKPVTIHYVFDNLDPEVEITIAMYNEEDGLIQKKKAIGETSLTFELTGKGKKTYVVYINGVGQELVIDFDEYGE
jgi:beta-lactam-binding protein with PASTA domain